MVLCVATKRPHKNQELLVRAATQLPDDVVVVLAGHPEPYDAELRSLAGGLGVDGSVVFADYVPDAELEALWGMAGCAAFPTRAEGFGMPVLEALARGVPVACSDLPVLREIGGELPRFFDPDDPADAARKVDRGARPAAPAARRRRVGGAGSPGTLRPQGTWRRLRPRARPLMLHVGLNLVFLIPGETGGMETAARETIPHLAAIDDLRLTLFVNREAAGTFGGVAEEVVVPVNATSRIQWVRGEQQHIPRLAARHGCELVHSLGSTAPLRGAFKRVTTIHDLNYRKVPESHFGLRGLGMRALVPAAARRSHRIIVDAESTRDDLRDLLKVDPRKVDVVPLGVTPARR